MRDRTGISSDLSSLVKLLNHAFLYIYIYIPVNPLPGVETNGSFVDCEWFLLGCWLQVAGDLVTYYVIAQSVVLYSQPTQSIVLYFQPTQHVASCFQPTQRVVLYFQPIHSVVWYFHIHKVSLWVHSAVT